MQVCEKRLNVRAQPHALYCTAFSQQGQPLCQKPLCVDEENYNWDESVHYLLTLHRYKRHEENEIEGPIRPSTKFPG